MNCEQLASRIKSLMHQIALMENELDDLEKQPRTPEIIQKIDDLENQINDMKKDVMRLNSLFKQNCK
ncbi:hypothetical protein [uncultured Acinetobacter sp.]|uniref:hypothetical protein n=1 Tax=uncultured Acinetobacter sp. TaxID=165433 RepID=UPI002621812A|nr:hypothetical protein [uncultured Acinetobacter sp.]